MSRRVVAHAAVAALLMVLSGCGFFQRPQRPAWRDQAERICLAEKRVQFSAYVQPRSPIEGPGICGLTAPLKVSALANGTVELKAAQTIGCPLAAALDQWIAEAVQPSAMARFGQPVVRVTSLGAYACRPIDNIGGAKLSEHAFGNAIDIAGFTLADGHEIVVVKQWTRGDPQEKAFLREAQAGACNYFTTVLAPGSDSYHYNHIHVDLAAHGATKSGPRRYCKPTPQPQLLPAPLRDDGLPEAPPLDEELDVARARRALPPYVSGPVALGRLDAATPPDPARLPNATRISRYPALGAGAPMPIGRRSRAIIREDGAFDPGEVGD
jgi:hypothetical protein